MTLKIHHIGVVVLDIAGATEDHRRRLGCEPLGEVFHDPVQTAYIQFLRQPGTDVLIELVAPDGPGSKLGRAAAKGMGINHLCFSADDIEAACEALRADGLFLIQEPVPAVAFAGRRIAWLMGDPWYLTELVERAPEGAPPAGIP